MKNILTLGAAALLVLSACQSRKAEEPVLTKSGLNPANFETVVDGDSVALYTLTNANGMEVCVTNFGGRIVSIMAPAKDGKMYDVVLGHDSIADYLNIDGNFGAIIGRYGNRIENGKFSLDGVEYELPHNNYGHCLHGGPKGFHNAVWRADQTGDNTIELTLSTPDGYAGFPGNVEAKVVYALDDENALHIDYTATTDKKTVLNLTNHSYFNLNGDCSKTVLNHVAFIESDDITPIDSTFMTHGTFMPVEGTPFDFRMP
ncbi:MAG: galactose mutarotase, partial [Muribaculaceae bacterium]|nr:galactose mutarotase [Muribaculaceae bacterium]